MRHLFSNLIRLTGKKMIFPFYHIVSDENCPHVRNLYPIKSVSQFKSELDFLLKHFTPIDLEELQKHLVNQTQPQKPSFLLSFDDGLRECHDIIAPILIEKGIPALFFLNSDFIDNKALFYRYKVSLVIEKIKQNRLETTYSISKLLKLNYFNDSKIAKIANDLEIDFNEFLMDIKPYMDWNQIKSLHYQGFKFGGHSANHPYYSEISLNEQIQQTKISVDLVQKKLNLDYKIFAFPFTDNEVKQKFFNQIFSQNICDITFGTAGIKDDTIPKNIQRLSMEKYTGNFERFFLKELLKYNLKKIVNKSIVSHPK